MILHTFKERYLPFRVISGVFLDAFLNLFFGLIKRNSFYNFFITDSLHTLTPLVYTLRR